MTPTLVISADIDSGHRYATRAMALPLFGLCFVAEDRDTLCRTIMAMKC